MLVELSTHKRVRSYYSAGANMLELFSLSVFIELFFIEPVLLLLRLPLFGLRYFQLWWWRSYLTSSSSALYLFIYCSVPHISEDVPPSGSSALYLFLYCSGPHIFQKMYHHNWK
ncbi:hypothetical protein Fmac_032701 [Flemingia macrophylla]|uniref:Uncharacterized protein n=1 Tax=Flemingia macrophylla TaxID=520843 RepID=A0ABD1L5M9_9FABA